MLKSRIITGAPEDVRHNGDKWTHARDFVDMEDNKDLRRNEREAEVKEKKS